MIFGLVPFGLVNSPCSSRQYQRTVDVGRLVFIGRAENDEVDNRRRQVEDDVRRITMNDAHSVSIAVAGARHPAGEHQVRIAANIIQTLQC